MNYFSVGTADVKSMSYLSPIWSRWTISRSERPMWSRCPTSCRVSADVKSMSYLMPSLRRSEVDELFPGLNGRFEVDVLFLGQDGRSMHSHRPVLFCCCIFVLFYWVWWRNLCAYKYVYVVGWRFLHNRELNCVCIIVKGFSSQLSITCWVVILCMRHQPLHVLTLFNLTWCINASLYGIHLYVWYVLTDFIVILCYTCLTVRCSLFVRNNET